MKIMLVTQQEEIRRMLQQLVTGTRDELVQASDLASGLAMVIEHEPALVLVDMALAGGAALALVHHVLAASTTTAVYALAAPAGFEAAGEALSLGAAGLVVSPPTGDSLLRVIQDVHARAAGEERIAKLLSEVRDAAELGDVMTQAVIATRGGDLTALGEALVRLFLVASGARGVAVYGEEDAQGVRPRLAGYGTTLELPDRYSDLELAQTASARQAEVVGLAGTAQMYGCVLLERPLPARSARVQRVTEFATALMPLFALAKAAVVEEATAPRSRALPPAVFERLVQRDVNLGPEVTLLCTIGRNGEVDTGPLGPALAVSGAAIGLGDSGEAYVLLPKTGYAAARGLLLDVPLPLGMAFAPADGTTARDLLDLAHTRARKAVRSQSLRELRNRSLTELVVEAASAKHPAFVTLAGSSEALESAVSHALRNARSLPDADVIIAAGSHVKPPTSLKAKVVSLKQPELADTAVVLVSSPRAGWALVSRPERSVHTGDGLALELLRHRLMEMA